MAKEAANELTVGRVFAYYSESDREDDSSAQNTYLCVDRKVHVKVSSRTQLTGWSEPYRGCRTNRQYAHSTSYWYKPCDGSCQTETYSRGERRALPQQVADEIRGTMPITRLHIASYSEHRCTPDNDDD